MALLPTPFPLPQVDLLTREGKVTGSDVLHSGGATLVLFGHKNCKTTRQTLPFIDRIHKDGGRVVALLQDTPVEAAAALLKLGLSLPFFCEPSPYGLASTIGLATVPTLLFVESNGTVSLTSEAFRRPDIEAFALRLGAPVPVIENDTMPGFKPG